MCIRDRVCEGHDNPIAELVQVACKFDSEITLESDHRKINAKSIMGVMAFNPSDGMTVDIVTKGDDEQEALVAIEDVYKRQLQKVSGYRRNCTHTLT